MMPIPTKKREPGYRAVPIGDDNSEVITVITREGSHCVPLGAFIVAMANAGAGVIRWRYQERPLLLEKPNPDCKGV